MYYSYICPKLGVIQQGGEGRGGLFLKRIDFNMQQHLTYKPSGSASNYMDYSIFIRNYTCTNNNPDYGTLH